MDTQIQKINEIEAKLKRSYAELIMHSLLLVGWLIVFYPYIIIYSVSIPISFQFTMDIGVYFVSSFLIALYWIVSDYILRSTNNGK